MKPQSKRNSSSKSSQSREPQSGKGQQHAGPRSSGRQQQAASGEGHQYGEGNYKATRDYNAGVKRHIQGHDVEREARDAAPRNDAERREMDEAERIGRSHAKDMQDSDDDMQEQ